MKSTMNKNVTVHYPHDEMTTFLLPVTIGCSYNRCKFCSMYVDDDYSEVSLREIKMQLMNGKHTVSDKLSRYYDLFITKNIL